MRDLSEAAEVDPETPSRKAFYRPEDVERLDYDTDLGDPGQHPYTRGIYPEMYRTRLWTMRQYAGYASAEESNQRYRYLLSQGTTGLSVAFDLPTQIGLDSDHLLAAGEVGRVGVAIDSLEDMEQLFRGIPLTKVSTSMTINATAFILLALYLALARRRGEPWAELRGNHPKRYIEGVHRPRDLYLSCPCLDANHHRHPFLLPAAGSLGGTLSQSAVITFEKQAARRPKRSALRLPTRNPM